MKIICSWCGKDMGEKEPLENKIITHGMCDECLNKLREEETKDERCNKC